MSTRKVQKGLEVTVTSNPNIGRIVTVPPEGFLLRLRIEDTELLEKGGVGNFVVDLVEGSVPDYFIAQLQGEISQLKVTRSERLGAGRHDPQFPLSRGR